MVSESTRACQQLADKIQRAKAGRNLSLYGAYHRGIFQQQSVCQFCKKAYDDYTPGRRTETFKSYSRKAIHQSITEPSPQCPIVARSQQIVQLFAHPGKTSTQLVLKLKHQSRFKIQKTKRQANLGESVEEGTRKTLAATTLVQWILAGKDAGALVLDVKGSPQLRHEHLPTVIQTGVETFQHRLGGQVHLKRSNIGC